MVKLEKIDRNVSPEAQIENMRGHNQTVSSVWDRMLGDEAEQQEEDCYHGDEDVALDRQST